MTAKTLKEVLSRVEDSPHEAQDQLAEIAREIDAQLADRPYRAAPDELRALDAAERDGLASEAEIEAAFATFRGA